MKKFIITGGNFLNTGAAAMSYITIYELRKRYPDCEIYMAIDYGDGKKHPELNCRIAYLLGDSMKLINHRLSFSGFVKAIIKMIIGRENIFLQVRRFKRIVRDCDAAFDVSGYILSSQWEEKSNLDKLAQINCILNYQKPYFILPQSFGPFDYKNKSYVTGKIRETLSRCSIVYAREHEGYILLKNDLDLKNVLFSYDMVLQNKEVDWKLVLNETEKTTPIQMDFSSNNVALIPNMRLIDHDANVMLVERYVKMINKLLELGKKIYLISHSFEDTVLCKQIKDFFAQDCSVVLLKEKMTSREFETIIQNMEFAIASRYHSIVHSYKNGIPCIILGWAVKYRELAEEFGQNEYVFDTSSLTNASESIISAIEKMNSNLEEEKKKIHRTIQEIQKSNCFDNLDF